MPRHKLSTEIMTEVGPQSLDESELEVIRKRAEEAVWEGVLEVSRNRRDAGSGYPDLSGLWTTGVKAETDRNYGAAQERQAAAKKDAIIGHLFPQQWINDQAVDCEPPREFDATEAVLRLDAETIRNLENSSDTADDIAIESGALGDHDGPIFVMVAENAQEFVERHLDLDDVSLLTDDMLERLREDFGVERSQAPRP